MDLVELSAFTVLLPFSDLPCMLTSKRFPALFSTQTTFVRHTSRRGGRQSTLRLVLISGYPLVRRIWGRATLRGSVDRFEKKASPSVPYHPLAKGACSVSLFFFNIFRSSLVLRGHSLAVLFTSWEYV